MKKKLRILAIVWLGLFVAGFIVGKMQSVDPKDSQSIGNYILKSATGFKMNNVVGIYCQVGNRRYTYVLGSHTLISELITHKEVNYPASPPLATWQEIFQHSDVNEMVVESDIEFQRPGGGIASKLIAVFTLGSYSLGHWMGYSTFVPHTGEGMGAVPSERSFWEGVCLNEYPVEGNAYKLQHPEKFGESLFDQLWVWEYKRMEIGI